MQTEANTCSGLSCPGLSLVCGRHVWRTFVRGQPRTVFGGHQTCQISRDICLALSGSVSRLRVNTRQDKTGQNSFRDVSQSASGITSCDLCLALFAQHCPSSAGDGVQPRTNVVDCPPSADNSKNSLEQVFASVC